jgi:hypothetical protein
MPRPPAITNSAAWGAPLWARLHSAAINSPPPHEFKAVIDRVRSALPCGECATHARAWLKDNPPPDDPAGLFTWTVQWHNDVNRRLGRPEFSLEEATRRWTITELPRVADDLSTYFDAVWCIHLSSDPDRWRDFHRQFAVIDWPFGRVTRFPAIHGDTVGVPDHYHQGGGAWGCLQSHRRVLELSLMAGHQRILVMEDDVDLRPGFGSAAAAFLAALDDVPWDCLMLGGQHMATPIPFKAGVVRAANIQRTHCMAFSRAFMRELYRYWSGPLDQHCDWSLGPFAARFRTYAPERFIAGQRGGRSHITGSQKPPEWWNPPRPNAPVVWLRCPREILESTRDLFHAGNRRNEHGVCLGLADLFDPARNPSERQQITALKSWISMIQWEVESLRGAFAGPNDGPVCTIWHPDVCHESDRMAKAKIVKAAAGNALFEIDATTEQEARQPLIARLATDIVASP